MTADQPTRSRTRGLLLLSALLTLSACEEVEQVQDRFRDETPHEAYLSGLRDAGLAQTALGRDWVVASRRALDEATPISLPFHERGVLTPDEAGAVAFRVDVARGRTLRADVALESEPGARVFVDVFRVPEDERDPLRPLYSTDSVPGVFEHAVMRTGSFVIRVQPELLRGGRYDVTLRTEAQLAFPVHDHGPGAIQSFFGADRDGGRRSHHGVDIFAPRGTPVLATADGTVSRVQVTNLGGKVVWLRDPARNASIYYAHLDSQYVRTRQQVRRGDTVGFVGNTGNARTTPPHLHFGIYQRGQGPTDPAPFIVPPRGVPAALSVDEPRLGEWVRVRQGGARLRTAPDAASDVRRELDGPVPLRTLAGSGDWLRVRMPDGTAGWISEGRTEPLERALETVVASTQGSLRSGPGGTAPALDDYEAGQTLPVLGRYNEFVYVRAPTGRTGWLAP